jgi:hypothetical protein
MNILRSTDGVNFTTIENEIPVANSYMDMGLPANTHFWYQVQVVDSAGASAASIPVDGTTLDYPPAVPTDLACTPDGNSAIQLSWANSGLGGAYTSIHVDRKSAGSEWIVDYRVLSATFESYTDTGLQPNTHYYYRIRAYNSGGYSEYTASVDTYTLPANPLPFTAKPHGFTAILLSWSYSGNPANFILERYKNGVKVKTINIASTARSYIDTGLLPWGKYDYKLYAVNTVRVEWKSSGVNSSTNTMGLAAQRHISLRR